MVIKSVIQERRPGCFICGLDCSSENSRIIMRVYNVYSRKKEDFVPADENKVLMYVCGPTTYDNSHLGHARVSVVFDIIYRYLEYKGYEVRYVQNFTDIDDKIIERAVLEEVPPLELSEKYIGEYNRVTDKLGIIKPDYQPRVSNHIPDIIEMIEGLIEKEFAYESEGNVFFDIKKYDDYGALSSRSIEDLEAGSRIEVDEKKKHPADFALWKKASSDEISWNSPWGKGRPGWHIECSTLSIKYLGESIDIHGGGQDLLFPHHENEIAQSEAYTGVKPFVRYWLHNGLVRVDEEKMSKSLGNFFTVKEVLNEYRPEVVRFFFVGAHYRSSLDYSTEQLNQARKQLERFEQTLEKINSCADTFNGEIDQCWDEIDEETKMQAFKKRGKKALDAYMQLENTLKGFEKAMDDDFNTPLAVAYLHDLRRKVNEFLNMPDLKVDSLATVFLRKIDFVFRRRFEILGITLDENTKKSTEKQLDLVSDLLDILLDIRSRAREENNYQLADKIRDDLYQKGIIVEDTAYGPNWRFDKNEEN